MGIMNPDTTDLIDLVAELVDSASQLPGLRGREAGLSDGSKVLHSVDKGSVVESDHWDLYRRVVKMDCVSH
jgi:hypothetical protein